MLLVFVDTKTEPVLCKGQCGSIALWSTPLLSAYCVTFSFAIHAIFLQLVGYFSGCLEDEFLRKVRLKKFNQFLIAFHLLSC